MAPASRSTTYGSSQPRNCLTAAANPAGPRSPTLTSALVARSRTRRSGVLSIHPKISVAKRATSDGSGEVSRVALRGCQPQSSSIPTAFSFPCSLDLISHSDQVPSRSGNGFNNSSSWVHSALTACPGTHAAWMSFSQISSGRSCPRSCSTMRVVRSVVCCGARIARLSTKASITSRPTRFSSSLSRSIISMPSFSGAMSASAPKVPVSFHRSCPVEAYQVDRSATDCSANRSARRTSPRR